MARSVKYWYNVIITEKDTLANLSAWEPAADTAANLLTDSTTSKLARWRIMTWCVASCAYVVDVLFDLFKVELASMVSRSRFGTLPWYAQAALNYQHGHNLVWQNNQYEYLVTDPDSKVVTFSDAVEKGKRVIVKIAGGTADNRAPIGATEEAGFRAYMNQVKAPGSDVQVINEAADQLRLFMKIKYNALILSETGESLIEPGVFPVEDAIEAYIASLPFGAFLEMALLIDEIQKVEGVIAPYLEEAWAAFGAEPFVQFSEVYEPHSGHMVIEGANPLSSTLTYYV